MARLILAEKPSMGRAIAAALGLAGSGRSFIQGQGLIVTWCVGHLVEALGPEGYDPALKSWRMDTLPIFPEAFRYAPIEQTKEQYETVARLLTREDVTEVVNATDAGREGELIFDLVYRLSGCAKPVLRFWTSSLTDEAIREAFGALKPGEAYAGLRDAARSRQEADWLVGINCTRAQTLVARRSGGEGVYSVGRVQTPTLAILVNREREILEFVPKDFWTLQAVFGAPEGSYRGKWFRAGEGRDQERFDTEAEARELAARLAGLPGQVRSVTGKTEKKKPELLYDLTTLQKEANKRFGFTAEHTLAVAQDLYEAKLLSYPRTNSRHLTKADEAKAAGWLKALAQGQLGELKPFLEELRGRWPAKLDKRFVDDAQVEDHSALVPTETPAQGLSGDRLKVYELVARRFLAAYFPERVEAKTAVITVIAEETFKTNGTVVKELGWSAVDPPHARPRKEKKAKEADPDAEEPEADEPEEEAGTLPPLARKQAVEVKDLLPKAGKTTPPKRMSEADLLAAMQGAGRELDDDELKGAMKDRGLGTPATRAGIIETLLKRGYLARKRNILQPTDKGMALITGLKAESLTSPQMTGAWEARLERMRRSEDTREAFMGDVKGFVAELVGQIRASSPAAAPRPVTGPVVGACPGCGGSLHLRTWEGRSYVRCGGDGCRVAYDTDAEGQPLERCPCGGPMRTFKDGGKACVVCGAREGEPAAPAPRPCPTCGQPMRVIPSTRRGQWFQRCSACGITEAG
ncbi:MAG TPA: DNA topoisomerase 3 [Holophaga sp.]|nr:DNA topoisomerase 3 [Holophaga sp.]